MLTNIQPGKIQFGQLFQTQAQPKQTSNVCPLFGHGLAADTIQFAGRRDILKEYGVDPAKVEVQFSKPGMKLNVPKRTALLKTLQGWEHARKNFLTGNQSGRFYVTNAHMQNGVWGLGTNIELALSDDILLCGERSATVRAFNGALDKFSLADFQDDAKRAEIKDGMKIDFMALSSGHKDFGDDAAAGSPCSECQSWISTKEYFSPTTQIASVIKDPDKDGHWILRVNEARDFLPLLATQAASQSDETPYSLPVDFSDKAKASLADMGVSEAGFEDTARELLNKSKTAFDAEPTENMSGQRYAVTALFPDSKIYTQARVDLNPRWPSLVPDLAVLAEGVREGMKPAVANRTMEHRVALAPEKPEAPQVQALAYWSETPKPTVQNVGKLAQKQVGNPNALVVVVENDRIQVRTLLDYITEIYVSGGGTYGGIVRQTEA